MKPPCKDCESRDSHCHSKCSEYKEYKENNDKQRALIQKKEREERLFRTKY